MITREDEVFFFFLSSFSYEVERVNSNLHTLGSRELLISVLP